MSARAAPTVAVTLGDPAGIGPELVAKLAARVDMMRQAAVVVVGDRWVWEDGQRVAGVWPAVREITSLGEARAVKRVWTQAGRPETGEPERADAADEAATLLFLPIDTVRPQEVRRGVAGPAGGASVLAAFKVCLDAARAGQIDAICFAPLNKHAMKQAGLPFPDELHFFADYLDVRGFVCELNVLDGLWTARVTSHIPLKDVVSHLSKDRIKDAAELLYRALAAAGVGRPRVAVAGLNPHAGEGGTCGREEIDIIEPAVREAREEGIPLDGPFPADTIFLKARAGLYDGILTMYHDQGQIATKLLGFDRGVTVQGGLPVPITTPAHGTAFDIAGQGKANVEALSRAFVIACRMGAASQAGRGGVGSRVGGAWMPGGGGR